MVTHLDLVDALQLDWELSQALHRFLHGRRVARRLKVRLYNISLIMVDTIDNSEIRDLVVAIVEGLSD